MNSSYGVDAYRSNSLNIAMQTSSGDLIKMDFSNIKSASISSSEDGNARTTTMRFSSEQSFQFSIKSNGITKQDQKEIDAFMKLAQPFIDKFISQLKEDSQNSPVTKIAAQIANIFEPSRSRSDNEKNIVKTNIVQLFDKNLQKSKQVNDVYESMKKLLEKALQEFDNFQKLLYA